MEEEKQKTKVEEEKKEEKAAAAPEKKIESKKEAKKPKTEAVVNSYDAHLSTKTSSYVCKFIVGKEIDKAMSDLNEVLQKKKAVPMKGEIPHRKGKIMSGRYPKYASEHFIKLLKTLAANASVNEIENPIIVEAIANIGSRPFGKFGRVRRKRTHIKIIAKNKAVKEKKK